MSKCLTHSLLAAAIGVSAAACATRPPASEPEARAAYDEANDPLEPLNRYFFELTRFADFLVLKPMAEIYDHVTPKPVRKAVSNFGSNLGEPWTLVNDLLQGEWERAGNTFGRFLLNSTLGVGGVFDPASAAGLERHSEDFSQTLAVYGVPPGPYLFTPFSGPSSFRGAVGSAAGGFLGTEASISRHIDWEEKYEFLAAHGLLGLLGGRADSLALLEEAEKSSADYYTTAREFYRFSQRRAILNNRRDETPLPDDDLGDEIWEETP